MLIGFFGFQSLGPSLLSRVDAYFFCPYTEIWVASSTDAKDTAADQGVQVSTATLKEFSYLTGCTGSLGGLVFAQLQPPTPPIQFVLLPPKLSVLPVVDYNIDGPDFPSQSFFRPPKAEA